MNGFCKICGEFGEVAIVTGICFDCQPSIPEVISEMALICDNENE